jgi:hypothetical protein
MSSANPFREGHPATVEQLRAQVDEAIQQARRHNMRHFFTEHRDALLGWLAPIIRGTAPPEYEVHPRHLLTEYERLVIEGKASLLQAVEAIWPVVSSRLIEALLQIDFGPEEAQPGSLFTDPALIGTELYDRLLASGQIWIATLLVQNPTLPQEVAFALLDRHRLGSPEVVARIAAGNESLVRLVLKDGDPSTIMALATRLDRIPERCRTEVAAAAAWGLRQGMPADVYLVARMCYDHLGDSAAALLVDGASAEVAQRVAERWDGAPGPVLDALLAHPDESVRLSLIRHTSSRVDRTPPLGAEDVYQEAILPRLLHDPRARVRDRALKYARRVFPEVDFEFLPLKQVRPRKSREPRLRASHIFRKRPYPNDTWAVRPEWQKQVIEICKADGYDLHFSYGFLTSGSNGSAKLLDGELEYGGGTWGKPYGVSVRGRKAYWWVLYRLGAVQPSLAIPTQEELAAELNEARRARGMGNLAEQARRPPT